MSDMGSVDGKVVVNRAMSLDGFIAAPGDVMDWGDGRPLADFVAPEDFLEVASATGAMLVGRRTWEVGDPDGGRGAGQPRLPLLRADVPPHP